jgi:hypothetical protein
MHPRSWRSRLSTPAIGVIFAPAIGLGALTYGNGHSITAAAVVATATAVVGLWAVATEP